MQFKVQELHMCCLISSFLFLTLFGWLFGWLVDRERVMGETKKVREKHWSLASPTQPDHRWEPSVFRFTLQPNEPHHLGPKFFKQPCYYK